MKFDIKNLVEAMTDNIKGQGHDIDHIVVDKIEGVDHVEILCSHGRISMVLEY